MLFHASMKRMTLGRLYHIIYPSLSFMQRFLQLICVLVLHPARAPAYPLDLPDFILTKKVVKISFSLLTTIFVNAILYLTNKVVKYKNHKTASKYQTDRR